MRNFIGRGSDLNNLEDIWKDGGTRLVCLYGRRRVGKSELIRVFAANKPALLFEAVEGQDTSGQIRHFLAQLSRFCGEPHLAHLNYTSWEPVFDLLTQKINQHKKLVLSFDELPWMAAGRSHLVAILKFYWDKHWKYHPHFMLILCGSVAAWMLKHIVKSKALYGRVSQSLLLDPLKPGEVSQYIGGKRGENEALEYYLCFGGIPRYLEEFNFSRSVEININSTCFVKTGFFVDEAEKIFYNQFREAGNYKKIVYSLMNKTMPLKDIADAVHLPSGGGLKNYLENLKAAKIIDSLPIIRDFGVQKNENYFLCDEYLLFSKHFIEPNRIEILKNERHEKFAKFTSAKWPLFLGAAFERLCLKYRYDIARMLGFDDKVVGCGPVLNPQKGWYQYDLVFIRNDHTVTVCEVKYQSSKPGTEIIAEMEQKLKRTSFPRGISVEKVLISNLPPSKPLKQSGYFNRIISASELLQGI